MDFLTVLPKGILNLPNLLLSMLYNLVKVILYIVDFTVGLFKALAGIDAVKYNGKSFGGLSSGEAYSDLLFAFLTDSTVQGTFFTLLGFSVVLLVIFTIVAMVKSEFTMDPGSAAKGPILSRSFKALAQFFMVPIFVLLGVVTANGLTRVVYRLYQANAPSITAYCFKVGAYTANRARNDEKFALFLSNGYYLQTGQENYFAGKSGDELADLIDMYMTGLGDSSGEATEEFTSTDDDGKSVTKKKYKINTLKFYEYSDNELVKLGNGKSPSNGVLNYSNYDKTKFQESENSKTYYAPWHTLWIGTPSEKTKEDAVSAPYMDRLLVNYFYDFSQFNFLMAIGTGCVLGWTLLSVGLSLLKRVFEMTLLFLLSPAVISLAPLDGGNAYSSWRKEILSRLFVVVGPLFAFNVFFTFVTMLEKITLFNSTAFSTVINQLYNIFFTTLGIIVASSMLKSASKFLSQFLGVKDLVDDGNTLMGKAGGALKRTVMTGAGAITGTTAVFRGTANMVKGGLSKTSKFGSDEYQKMQKNKSELKDVDNKLSALEDFGADKPDSDKHEEYTKLMVRKEALKTDNKKLKEKISQGDVHIKGRLTEKANEQLKEAEDNYNKVVNDSNSTADQRQFAREKLDSARDRLDKVKEKDKKYNEAQKESAKRSAKNYFMGYEKDGKHVDGVFDKAKDSAKNFFAPGGEGFGDNAKVAWSRLAGGFGDDNPAIKLISQFGKADGRKGFYESAYEKKLGENAKKAKDKKEAKEKEKKEKEEAAEAELELSKKRKMAEMEVERQARESEHAQRIEELLKQFVVKGMGDEKHAEYNDLLEKRKSAIELGDEASIKELNAKIDKFETDNEVAVKTENAKQDIVNNEETKKDFEGFREELRKKGEEDAKRKMGIKEDTTINVKTPTGGDLKVSFKDDNEFAGKLGKTIGSQLSTSLKGVNNLAGGMKNLQSTIQSVKSGQDSLVELLGKINEKLDKKK